MAFRFSHTTRRGSAKCSCYDPATYHSGPAMTGILTSLEQMKSSYGDGRADAKLALLARLERSRLATARAVLRLHEALCFLLAYPDDARVHARVERMLESFHRRTDLRRHRAVLADSGIAGTAIHYRFFWSSASWLARRWPDCLVLDRGDPEPAQRIRAALPLLVTPAEAAWLREARVPAFRALDRLRGPEETDATFLARRVQAMPGDAATREAYYDAIDAACILKPGANTPARTHARFAGAAVSYRKLPLRRGRPDLREQIARAPRGVHELTPREGARLLDLARGVMVTRARDLDAFAYGAPRDVRIVDDGDGLEFALNGVMPARRAFIAGTYAYLTLQNGVPIGYGDLLLIGRSVAVAFNIFETFRGGESAWTFARLLSMLHYVFGSDSVSLDPYQLGYRNEEAITSGAWWFYFKLGFRPRAADACRIVHKELARMTTQPDHRSDRATLRKLASRHLFFDIDAARPRGLPRVAEVGASIATLLAQRAGADRERAVRECAREAAGLLGLRSLRGFSADERLAFARWSPLVASLPELRTWSAADKRGLVQVIRAKGGRRESDFVERFAVHPKLSRALFAEL